MSIKQIQKSHNKNHLSLIGFFIYLLTIFIIAVFLFKFKIVPWPFHGADTVSGTYARINIYIPFALLSVIAIFWMKSAGIPVWKNIKWSSFHASFLAGLCLSAGYALFLFISTDFDLKGLPFVPPALILCLLNAVAEEFLFRLVMFQLLIRSTGSIGVANSLQSLFYGLPHLLIGGPSFFLYAFFYGLILGWVTHKNASVFPAILCHFVIDVGAIGLPLLILL